MILEACRDLILTVLTGRSKTNDALEEQKKGDLKCETCVVSSHIYRTLLNCSPPPSFPVDERKGWAIS